MEFGVNYAKHRRIFKTHSPTAERTWNGRVVLVDGDEMKSSLARLKQDLIDARRVLGNVAAVFYAGRVDHRRQYVR